MKIIKYIFYSFVIFSCFGFMEICGTDNRVAGGGDPCGDMGASGTYDFWWNGEYDSDTNKACIDSGNSVADPTDESAGVIVVGGAINGSYGALLNASGEHVRWAANSGTMDVAGTVQMTVTTPASFTDEQTLFEIYTDANNMIIGYYHDDTSRIYLMHEGDGNTRDYHYITAPAVATTATLYFSWEVVVGNDTLALKMDAGAWDKDAAVNADEFGGTVDDYSIGYDQNDVRTDAGDTWKIDDVQFREGYEGS